ncbi:MAG: DUF4180 domain-containing protein [Archangium sp.]
MTAPRVEVVGSKRVLFVSTEGPLLAAERDVLDLIGATFGQEIDTVAIPAARLGPDFFSLRSGLAGAVTQKFVNYQLRLAIVGDVSTHVRASDAFRDWVIESNRGRQLWFVADQAELISRLSA